MGTRQQPVKRDPPPPIHSGVCIQGGTAERKVCPSTTGTAPCQMALQRESQQLERERPFFFWGGGVMASRRVPSA